MKLKDLLILSVVFVAIIVMVFIGLEVLQQQDLIIDRQQVILNDRDSDLTELQGLRKDINNLNDNLSNFKEQSLRNDLTAFDERMDMITEFGKLVKQVNDLTNYLAKESE